MELACKKIARPLLEIVKRREWVSSTDEADVAASRSELELQQWIVFRDPANIVKNLLWEKWIVNRV